MEVGVSKVVVRVSGASSKEEKGEVDRVLKKGGMYIRVRSIQQYIKEY